MAKSYSFEDFSRDSDVRLALFFSWWKVLCHVDCGFLMDMYLKAVPSHVQMVLGQSSFELTDMLTLVGKWRFACWGVYVDILTKSAEKDWYRLYVGSTTSMPIHTPGKTTKGGLWSRIHHYFSWLKYKIPKARENILKTGGAHVAAILPTSGYILTPLFLLSSRTTYQECIFFS